MAIGRLTSKERGTQEPTKLDAYAQQLVLQHLEVPRSVVKHLWYLSAVRQMGWDEAVQEATLGLLKAVTNARSHTRLKAYAYIACKGTLLRAVRKRVRWVRREMEFGHLFWCTEGDHSGGKRTATVNWIGEMREALVSLLQEMPAGKEKTYLESRLAGEGCRIAWERSGMPGVSHDGLRISAIKLCRKILEEQAIDAEPIPTTRPDLEEL